MTYDIPYRTLLPQKVAGLLVAGRCFSATHDAHASCRSMAQTMAMGQAAGTAAALAAKGVGSPVYMERVRDYSFQKPWHLVNSRFAVQPESGGVNGQPSTAEPAEGERLREQVVVALAKKVYQAIEDSCSHPSIGSPQP